MASKEQVIAALLENPTLTAAAEAAGVSRRTVYNYLSDADFAEAFRQQRIAQAIAREEQLSKERAEALRVVREIMFDTREPGAVRLKAAAKLLEEAHTAQVAVDAISKSLSFEASWH